MEFISNDALLTKNKIINLLNNNFPISKDEYRIDFKAALVLLDIYKECNDIDITISDSAAELLSNSYPNEYVISKVYNTKVKRIIISDRIECYTSPDKNAINNSFKEDNGFRLAYINDILNMYIELNRPKDQEVIKRLSNLINNVQ